MIKNVAHYGQSGCQPCEIMLENLEGLIIAASSLGLLVYEVYLK